MSKSWLWQIIIASQRFPFQYLIHTYQPPSMLPQMAILNIQLIVELIMAQTCIFFQYTLQACYRNVTVPSCKSGRYIKNTDTILKPLSDFKFWYWDWKLPWSFPTLSDASFPLVNQWKSVNGKVGTICHVNWQIWPSIWNVFRTVSQFFWKCRVCMNWNGKQLTPAGKSWIKDWNFQYYVI